jgi:hypothetical protein
MEISSLLFLTKNGGIQTHVEKFLKIMIAVMIQSVFYLKIY